MLAGVMWDLVFMMWRLASSFQMQVQMMVCLVLLSGSAQFTAGDIDFGLITGRKSVFDRTPPHAVYLPHKTSWSVRAAASAEIAVCRAPGMTKDHGPRLITPDQMPLEQRGTGTNTRFVCNILPETEPADSLLVVEVITPAGNWSSYPPHKLSLIHI